MAKVNCLLLLMLFTLFTVRTSFTLGESKRTFTSIENSSSPISDENPGNESGSDDSSVNSETEDYQYSEIQSIYFQSCSSQNRIHLQRQIFDDLTLEVSTPPPQG